MTPEIIAAVGTAIATSLTLIFGLIRWLTKTFLQELRPNGGSSIKDQISRLEERVDSIYLLLAETKMPIENVYYRGELIPVDQWDFDLKKPKAKKPKAKKTKQVETVIDSTFIENLDN